MSIEYAGERHVVPSVPGFSIGRAGDLVIDDNPHLHRRFLMIRAEQGMWWIHNVGSHLTATVCDRERTLQAALAPGGRMPVLADILDVIFTAGRTVYDLTLLTHSREVGALDETVVGDGELTAGHVSLNHAQRLLLLVLAEDALRGTAAGGSGDIPSSAAAAKRLGWTVPAFTRRLDHLCLKLERAGARGLRAGGGRVSTHRRLRLVEYAITTRLISRADLAILDALPRSGQDARNG
ncbi:hypothetical protein [Pseudolysinimonas sp.]|uniref:hypothetical protein n=1 Tax=Pseudolysinimonas sp. TaxID=2680009 RepID=UPI00286C40AB|nr:hypothetical protein [Pseudolysinimonas sp.]